MIAIPGNVRFWLATGDTDMRRIPEPCAPGSGEFETRSARCRERSRPLVVDLEIRMRQQRALLTLSQIVILQRPSQPLGRVHPPPRRRPRLSFQQCCRTSPYAVWRSEERNWTFAGSDAGGHRIAAVHTLPSNFKRNVLNIRVKN
jgi:transposase